MEQESQSSCVEIRNIPMKEKETADDIYQIENVGNTINLNINQHDIRYIYRLPGKPGRNKIIVVDFSAVSMKHKVLSCARNYNRSKDANNRLNTGHAGIPGQTSPM